MAKRVCPQCGVRGLDHLTSRKTDRLNDAGNPWYEVVCNQCGHVYGALASRVPASAPDEPDELNDTQQA